MLTTRYGITPKPAAATPDAAFVAPHNTLRKTTLITMLL
jgi:hypothetical protein